MKQDGRLPPAYFKPTNLVKDDFEKDENVFFSKNFLHQILYFFKIKKILFSANKSLTIQVEKTFSRKIISWYASKFATFTDFEKKSGVFSPFF